jgi:hypothetical protein
VLKRNCCYLLDVFHWSILKNSIFEKILKLWVYEGISMKFDWFSRFLLGVGDRRENNGENEGFNLIQHNKREHKIFVFPSWTTLMVQELYKVICWKFKLLFQWTDRDIRGVQRHSNEELHGCTKLEKKFCAERTLLLYVGNYFNLDNARKVVFGNLQCIFQKLKHVIKLYLGPYSLQCRY